MPNRQTGFLRDGRSAHRWQQWVRDHRDLIDELGLPADVVATREEFDYLLLHQYSRAGYQGVAPWFKTFYPSDPRRERFWDLLESYIPAFYPNSVSSARDMLWRRFGKPGGGQL